jgi:hypothetical protein
MAKNEYRPDGKMDITLVRPLKPIGSKPNPGRPVVGKPEKPEQILKPIPVNPKPKPRPKPDFGKQLGQQPITMGEDYKKEIDTIRPIGNGSAMRNQYRAQGGGRFK